jgi:hypothetical protein
MSEGGSVLRARPFGVCLPPNPLSPIGRGGPRSGSVRGKTIAER